VVRPVVSLYGLWWKLAEIKPCRDSDRCSGVGEHSSGHIFAGTYFGGGVFRSADNGDSWTPVNNGLDCGNIWSLAVNPVGTIFAGTAGCGTGVYRSTNNGDSLTLINIGLTSTDVSALAVNGSDYHVFAGTHPMGKGGGMFRSTNDAKQWSDVSSGLLPPRGNVWAVASGGTASGDLPMPKLVASSCSAAFNHRRGASQSKNQGASSPDATDYGQAQAASLSPVISQVAFSQGRTHFGDSR
jgi:hypothetical protein